MQVNGTRMLRVKTVAAMYDVSAATIYRAIESGQLVALKLGSERALRIPETALPAFEESRQVTARANGEGAAVGGGPVD
jgi:excisionase family DNA binding protein